jgi:hypothetical protein
MYSVSWGVQDRTKQYYFFLTSMDIVKGDNQYLHLRWTAMGLPPVRSAVFLGGIPEMPLLLLSG